MAPAATLFVLTTHRNLSFGGGERLAEWCLLFCWAEYCKTLRRTCTAGSTLAPLLRRYISASVSHHGSPTESGNL